MSMCERLVLTIFPSLALRVNVMAWLVWRRPRGSVLSPGCRSCRSCRSYRTTVGPLSDHCRTSHCRTAGLLSVSLSEHCRSCRSGTMIPPCRTYCRTVGCIARDTHRLFPKSASFVPEKEDPFIWTSYQLIHIHIVSYALIRCGHHTDKSFI